MSDKNAPKVEDVDCEAFPCFKRNNYFYGKLLTVEDFQVEQQYFINKQRLINRLVHGAGIICGLKVLRKGSEATDLRESQIRITEGVAIDSCGREIVIPSFVDLDLSEYLKNEDGNQLLYVCVRYDFWGEEKIPKVLDDSTCQDVWDYSRIKEGYRIEVGKSLPKQSERCESDICTKWDDYIKYPERNEFFLKKCYDTFEDEVLVLAKVIIKCRKGSVFVSKVDNLTQIKEVTHRQIVYSNVHLFNLVTCLRKRIDKLETLVESLREREDDIS